MLDTLILDLLKLEHRMQMTQILEQLIRQLSCLEPFEALFSESNNAQAFGAERVINGGPEDLPLRYLSRPCIWQCARRQRKELVAS